MPTETTNVEPERDELPDRDFTWREIDPVYADAKAYSPDVDRVSTNRSTYSSIHGNALAYLPNGTGTLTLTDELTVPKYYSRFDDFAGHILELDTGNGNSVAWGMTESRLENALRVITGGGRYRHGDVSVHATEKWLYVFEYDGDVWAVAPERINSLPEDYEPNRTDVCGFSVPDDEETVLRGMKRFVQLLPEHYGEEIVGYDHLSPTGYHHFACADGSTAEIKGSYLKKLGSIAWTSEEVQTDYEIETDHGEQYSVSWDDVKLDIGDPIAKMYDGGTVTEEREKKECVAGYQMRWEDPRTSSRVSMNGKIKCKATYFYILYRENYDRYEVRDRSDVIAEFEPYNKEWSPY